MQGIKYAQFGADVAAEQALINDTQRLQASLLELERRVHSLERRN